MKNELFLDKISWGPMWVTKMSAVWHSLRKCSFSQQLCQSWKEGRVCLFITYHPSELRTGGAKQDVEKWWWWWWGYWRWWWSAAQSWSRTTHPKSQGTVGGDGGVEVKRSHHHVFSPWAAAVSSNMLELYSLLFLWMRVFPRKWQVYSCWRRRITRSHSKRQSDPTWGGIPFTLFDIEWRAGSRWEVLGHHILEQGTTSRWIRPSHSQIQGVCVVCASGSSSGSLTWS